MSPRSPQAPWWLAVVSLAALTVSPPPLHGAKRGWFTRSDPKIRTLRYIDFPHARINDQEVAVYPFAVSRDVRPEPPDFAPIIERTLLEAETADRTFLYRRGPWEARPAWEYRSWNDDQFIEAIIEQGQRQCTELAIFGRFESLHRTANQGLHVRLRVYLIAPLEDRILWYGTKTADWVRYFPVDDCLLRLAWDFVAEWLRPVRR